MRTHTVQGLLDGLNEFVPFSLAEEWDNVGLMIGDPEAVVSGVLIGLDPCLSLLKEAVASGVNTVVSHHPLIFHPVKSINLATVEGQLISFVIRHELNVIACHTNFDLVAGGVSHILAETLGIEAGKPLVQKKCDADCGFGWIGALTTPQAGEVFLEMIARNLQQPNLLVAGSVPSQVVRVAVCGGSCGDFARIAMGQGADILITSEIKHSQARWAEDAGMCLVDASHFSTENIALTGLQEFICESMDFPEVHLSQIQDRPLRGYRELLEK